MLEVSRQVVSGASGYVRAIATARLGRLLTDDMFIEFLQQFVWELMRA